MATETLDPDIKAYENGGLTLQYPGQLARLLLQEISEELNLALEPLPGVEQ
jgi:hypothetical protein